ncbi:MAG: hypothetical protein ABSG86_24355 [Thermoguttaceae bacterium]|jgi:hypothetical protein
MARRLLRGLAWVAGCRGRKLLLALVLLGLSGGNLMAAGGGQPVTQPVHVVDTEEMAPGVTKWVAEVYNDNLWLFGLLVVATMALEGAALGFLFDRLIGMLGVNLGKIEHRE